MFYKKFISALLAVILFAFAVCSVPVPAQASDRGGAYVNILDYATIKGRTDNYISISNGSSVTVTWDFTDTLGQVRGFEFEIWGTYRSSDFTVDSVTFGTVAATDVSLEIPYSGIFRITGNFHDTSRSTVSVKLTSSATTYFNFERLFIYTVGTNRVPLTAAIHGGSPADDEYYGGESFSYTYTSAGFNDHSYEIVIPFHQWSACDFVDLNFCLSTVDISSVSAFIYNGVFIPIDYSSFDLENDAVYGDYGHPYYVNMRLDLRDVEPGTLDTDLLIVLSHTFEEHSILHMFSLFGVFLSEGVDVNSTWHQVLYRTIVSGFDGLMDILTSTWQLLSTMNTRVSNILTAVNNFRTSFITFAEDFQVLMMQNTDAITDGLVSLGSSISQDFSDITRHLDSWFVEFKGFFQQLVNGTPVDETVTNEMQDAENELGGMTDQMQQSSPDISPDDIEISVGVVPDDGSIDLTYSFFSFLWENSFLVSMLTTVLAISTMSFVFFGKR